MKKFEKVHVGIAVYCFFTFLPATVYAGSCSYNGATNTMTCSGPADPVNDVRQQYSNPNGSAIPLTIVTTPGFGLDVPDIMLGPDDGITMGSFTLFDGTTHDVIFRDVNNSVITAGQSAVELSVHRGDVTVFSNGTYSGGNQSGLSVATDYGSIDIVTEGGDITAESFTGLGAITNNSAATFVPAPGDSDSADISIVTRNNIRGTRGIGTNSLGTGNVTVLVESTSTVQGIKNGSPVTSIGVFAGANGTGGDVDITINGAVFGTEEGVRAQISSSNLTGSSVVRINDGATVTTDPGGVAIRNTFGDSVVTVAAGATVVGDIALGDGSDILNYSGDPSTIPLFDGGDDVSSADGFVDELYFTNSVGALNAVENFELVVVGAGSNLTKPDGVLVTEQFTITDGGRFDALDTFALTGNLTVQNGGLFELSGGGSGRYSVSGNVINNSTINMQDGATGDELSVAGNYSGTGTLNSDINTDTNGSDVLRVAGNTSGNTLIGLNDIGSGIGQATGTEAGDGIPLVVVGGDTAATDFRIENDEFIAGAFRYTLNLAEDNTHYLQSEILPQTETNAQIMSTMVNSIAAIPSVPLRHVDTLSSTYATRVVDPEGRTDCVYRADLEAQLAEEGFSSDVFDEQPCEKHYAWIRLEGSELKMAQVDTNVGSFDESRQFVHFGYDRDLPGKRTNEGYAHWVVGINGHVGESDVDANGSDNTYAGSVDKNFQGFGVNATRYYDDGYYTDFVAQYSEFDADISTIRGDSSTDGDNLALSAEVGKSIVLSADETEVLTLTPQLQIIYSDTDFDSFDDPDGVTVSVTDGSTTTARLGAVLRREQARINEATGEAMKPSSYYVRGSLFGNIDGETEIDAAGTRFEQNDHDSWIGIGIGGEHYLREDLSLSGEVNYRHSLDDFGDSYEYGALIKLRKSF